MVTTYNTSSAKKATNLSINSDLLRKAKEYKINLSKHFEDYLNQLVKDREEKKWLEENQEAIERQNHRIKQNGTFSDSLRRF